MDGLHAANYPVVLAKAAWYLAAEDTDYDGSRVFPQLAAAKTKPMKP